MQYYLRLKCYDDPSRRSSTQIHADIAVDGPPHFQYGEPLQAGDDADDSTTWPRYVVAHIPLVEQMDDPARPGKIALVIHVYLAREEQWEQFEEPQVVREIRERERGDNSTS